MVEDSATDHALAACLWFWGSPSIPLVARGCDPTPRLLAPIPAIVAWLFLAPLRSKARRYSTLTVATFAVRPHAQAARQQAKKAKKKTKTPKKPKSQPANSLEFLAMMEDCDHY